MSSTDAADLDIWQPKVEKHDYDAAFSYLSLRLGDKQALKAISALKHAELEQRRANDILRACRLPALPITDPGVHRDLLKVIAGEHLSPVLIISVDGYCEIADGYHRVCVAAGLSPYMQVPHLRAAV